MTILNKMNAPGHSNFYQEDWRNLIDQHLDYLKASTNTIVIDVEPIAAHKYAGDLPGFLVATQVPMHFYYVVLKLNDMTDGTQFGKHVQQLLIPSEKDLDKLMNTYITTYS